MDLSRFYHVSPICCCDLNLRRRFRCSHLYEKKLAEACASRTHRRHQGCRPPVLKITQRVLIGSENSLLYSILCPLSRKGLLTVFALFGCVWAMDLSRFYHGGDLCQYLTLWRHTDLTVRTPLVLGLLFQTPLQPRPSP